MTVLLIHFWNHHFSPLFVFGEFSKPQFFSAFNAGRNSQHFWPDLNERKLNFTHSDWAESEDYALRGRESENFKSDPTVKIVVVFKLWDHQRQSLRNRLCHNVHNSIIFHLRPVPSKNIENCELWKIWKHIIFEKKSGVLEFLRYEKKVKKVGI